MPKALEQACVITAAFGLLSSLIGCNVEIINSGTDTGGALPPPTGGTAGNLGGNTSGVGSAVNPGGGLGGIPNSGGVGGTGGSGLGPSSATGGGGWSTGGMPASGGMRPTGGRPPVGGQPPTGGLPGIGGATGGGGPITGGSSGTGGGEGGSVAISGLRVEPNPNSVLSAYVTWTTNAAAGSTVQFGEGQLEWEISDPEPVLDHRVLVIGMHADSTYQINAVSGNASQTTTFTTSSLPAYIPVGQVTVHDAARTQPGWTLMNVQKGDGNSFPTSDYPAMGVMYDSEGLPVWYYVDGTNPDFGGAISADLTDRGVLMGPVMGATGGTVEVPREVDFAGNTIWECQDLRCGASEGELTHHAGKISNGDYDVVRWITEGDSMMGGDQVPIFDELGPNQERVKSWALSDFVDRPANPETSDWCHGNSMTVDIPNDAVYLSCRWMGLVKVTYNDPRLVWHLPASYNAAGMGDMQFVPPESQFSDIHDPEIHDDGTILFFDNGGWDASMMPGPTTTEHHSRAVEYRIDEAAKTATLVWEFPGNYSVDSWYRNDWYQSFWGDADRLENGNVLITAGLRGTDTDSRIFEVTKDDGQVVWELHLGPDIGVYRSERITPPLLKPIDP